MPLLDIDHFEQVNDVHGHGHGHGTGDETLRAFTQRVREHLRQGDTCARYGGEEFVVVLPATTLERGREVAERALVGAPPITATVSIGAAQHEPGESIEGLLERADTAVSAAERGGRNRVRVPEAVAA